MITRPRRFGKTLTMSMLDYFFSNKYEGRSDLFEGLDVWKDEKFRKLQGTYPVIFLSFAGVKQDTYEKTKEVINELIARLYNNYEQIIFNQLDNDIDAVWSLLLASGYLKCDMIIREKLEDTPVCSRSYGTWHS